MVTNSLSNVLITALHPNHMGICENGLISVNRYFSMKDISFQRLVIFAGRDWETPRGINEARLRSLQHDLIDPGEEGKRLPALYKADVEIEFGDFDRRHVDSIKELILSVERKMQELAGNRLFLHLDCGTSTQGIALSLNGLRHDATCVYRMSPLKKPVQNVYETGDLREVSPKHLVRLWRHETKGRLSRDLTKWEKSGKLGDNLASYIPEMILNDATRKCVSYNERCETLRDEFGSRYNDFLLAEDSLKKHLRSIFLNRYSPEIQFRPKIDSRTKEFPSFWKKLQDKEADEGIQHEPFSRITDCVGAKVVFYNLGDYKAGVKILEESELFVSKDGGPVKGENKKKNFEYEATHFDLKLSPGSLGAHKKCLSEIPLEIQLKTIIGDAMNFVHHELVYKDFNRPHPLTTDEKVNMVAQFRTAGSNLGAADKVIDDICKKYGPKKTRRLKKK